MNIIAHIDAGTRGKRTATGPSACGAIVQFDSKKISKTEILGITTINVSEWSGLILALQIVYDEEIFAESLDIYSDSKLVVQQSLGLWQVRELKLKPLRAKALHMAQTLKNLGRVENIRISHVRREQNQEADALVRSVLDDYVRSLK